MAVLTTGNTFSNGNQVTASSLNNAVNDAEFAAGAVDNTSTQLSSGAIIVKDLGISSGKIAIDAVGTDQLANDVVISTSGSITGAAGSFTTLTASGDISVDGSVKQSGNTGNLILKGGDTDGANIELYGSSSSYANEAFYDASTHSFRPEDGSSNRVVISSSGLTASGDLTVDTTTLKVDSTNNRVGIGTASPAVPLDVNGQARVVGNLFVGTDDTTPNGMIEVYGGGTGQNEGGEIRLRTAADFDTTYNHYFIDAYQDDLRIGREGGADITLTSDGSVGIGTTSPQGPLHVVDGTATGQTANSNGHGIILDSKTDPMGMSFLADAGEKTSIFFGDTDSNDRGRIEYDHDGDKLIFRSSADTIFFEGSDERFCIKSGGNVGIGTSSPANALHVVGDDEETSAINTATATSLEVAGNGTSINSGGTILFSANSGSWKFAAIKALVQSGTNNTVGDLAFSTRPVSNDSTLTEAMRIRYNGNVGIGTASPSAPLEVTSTTGGVILPRMTTTQMNDISSPANGEMIYNTIDNKFYGYANGAWVALH